MFEICADMIKEFAECIPVFTALILVFNLAASLLFGRGE